MKLFKGKLGLQQTRGTPNKNTHPSPESEATVLRWLNEVFPTGSQSLGYVLRLLPFLRWIRHYNLRWFVGDLVAGATVGVVVIPESIGYAKLAGLPAQYGLYTSFMGGVVYWFFATSKDITIGPVAIMSTVVGSIVTDVQALYPGISGPQIAMSITVICGSIVTFMGLARLGFVLDFIPLPSITAFVTGSAIAICAGQVKNLLGETAAFSTRAPTYQVLIDALKHLPSAQKYDSVMGISALITLYGIRTVCKYTATKFPGRGKLIFFLSALRIVFVIISFTIISVVVNCHREDNPAFVIVGNLPRGFQDVGPPQISGSIVRLFIHKLPACVIVLILEHIAVAKHFGRNNNYTIDPSQELIAIGVTNLLGPFIGAYSATGSFSRTAIQAKSGARTPLAGMVTAIVVLISMYALTNALYYIPNSTLSAVIIHAVGDLIVSPITIYQFWQIAPLDAIIFAVGLVVAVANTIPNSIYVTVCLAVILLLFQHAKSPGHFLGQTWIGEEDSKRPLFLPNEELKGSHANFVFSPSQPGVFIYQFSANFNYPNASHYTDAMVKYILHHTRRNNEQISTRKGDKQWNDSHQGEKKNDTELPLLRAIILDFGAVINVDVTSVQNLVDVRNQLNHRTAPLEVEWHFVSIRNEWTKRALTAAGFGIPLTYIASPAISGNPISSLKSHSDGTPIDVEKGGKASDGCRKGIRSLEKHASNDVASVSHRTDCCSYFHVDLTSALESVKVQLELNSVR
ncbi:sulfate anion transporter [Penicillium waksmanii]|uniref:sulfate anion transporter n=1 Tax=Penicillium waksmanii TaxID=69791 RepID=UPI002549A49B|nr:sulfate anion transporter [Penicillium waksmanii]KAJ5979554.1 sulfate anion transporter [Penicillium waksmanii]